MSRTGLPVVDGLWPPDRCCWCEAARPTGGLMLTVDVVTHARARRCVDTIGCQRRRSERRRRRELAAAGLYAKAYGGAPFDRRVA